MSSQDRWQYVPLQRSSQWWKYWLCAVLGISLMLPLLIGTNNLWRKQYAQERNERVLCETGLDQLLSQKSSLDETATWYPPALRVGWVVDCLGDAFDPQCMAYQTTGRGWVTREDLKEFVSRGLREETQRVWREMVKLHPAAMRRIKEEYPK